MNTKVKAVVLATSDYKDNDKLAEVFTRELGRISVKFIGVKRAKAKLKSLCQPFCSIELEMISKGNFYTATTASIIDSHSNIVTDYPALQAGYVILDAVKSCLLRHAADERIYDLLTTSLRLLDLGQSAGVVVNSFLYYMMNILGSDVGAGFDLSMATKLYLDTCDGVLLPVKISNTCLDVDKAVVSELRSVICDNISTDPLVSVMLTKLLTRIILIKFDTELKSVTLL